MLNYTVSSTNDCHDGHREKLTVDNVGRQIVSKCRVRMSKRCPADY